MDVKSFEKLTPGGADEGLVLGGVGAPGALAVEVPAGFQLLASHRGRFQSADILKTLMTWVVGTSRK
jgi:hypothetical protein